MLLIHQIPPTPPYLRVKVGRHLQRLGAVAIKNSVYALPRTAETQEDLQWVLGEIVKGGGEASIIEARFVDGISDDDVVQLFQSARESDYRAVVEQARAVSSAGGGVTAPYARSDIARLRRRLAELAEIDFFGAPGREAAEGLVSALETRMIPDLERGSSAGTLRREDHESRVWVTREGIKVDRMASAWLIRKFIDPHARFKFVPAKGYEPRKGELRFDMFEAEFTHDGDLCTFEVLVQRFGLGTDGGLRWIAEIVHDVDLKDAKFGREEAAGIAQVVSGIAAAHPSDEERLTRGAAVFDDLYALHGAARTK